MTMPSSAESPAISVSIWPRNSSAPFASSEPARAASSSFCFSRSGRSAVTALGTPWSVATAPISRKKARRLRCAAIRPAPACGVLAGELGEPRQVRGKARRVGIGDVVGAIGGADAAAQPLLFQLRVMVQRIEREFGGGDRLDIGAVEDGERPQRRLLQALRIDRVEQAVGIVGRKRLVDAESPAERVLEPQSRRRAGEDDASSRRACATPRAASQPARRRGAARRERRRRCRGCRAAAARSGRASGTVQPRRRTAGFRRTMRDRCGHAG